MKTVICRYLKTLASQVQKYFDTDGTKDIVENDNTQDMNTKVICRCLKTLVFQVQKYVDTDGIKDMKTLFCRYLQSIPDFTKIVENDSTKRYEDSGK